MASRPAARRARSRDRSPRTRWTADLETLERRDCPATVGIGTLTPNVAEAGGTATFTISLSPTAKPVTVNYLAGGSATFAADYRLAIGGRSLAPTGTITFAPSPYATSRVITVTPVNDAVREGDEPITFSLLASQNATLGTRTATMTVKDDDNYTASIRQVSEATPGGLARFSLQLSSPDTQLPAPATRTETFYVSTSDGTAVGGRDYQALTRAPLVISPGQTSSRDFWVPVSAAGTVGSVFFVTVEPATPDFPAVAPIGATIGLPINAPPTGTNELIVSDASLLEGNTGTRQAIFTVMRTGSTAGTVTVNYATADGTAKVSDIDYRTVTSTIPLTFASGETVKTVAVPIVGDKKLEADETFSLVLSGESGASVKRRSGTGTIRNDEAGYVPPPVPWTILVYMTGVDLNDYAFQDINEMEAALAGMSGGVRIVVSWDQPPASDGTAYATAGGAQAAWRTYGRSVLKADTNMNSIASSFDTSFGEKNTGDPATLVDFVQWATLKAPADHYLLQMWGHGGGLDGSQFDSESRGDAIEISEIAAALTTTGMPTIDVLSYDNCLMGMAEVGYAISSKVTGQFVASEELVNGTGQDYTTAYSALATAPQTVTAAAVAAGMVTSYDKQYHGDAWQCDTYSAVATSGYAALANAVSQFVTTWKGLNLTPADRMTLQDIANTVPNYSDLAPTSFVDLGGFMSGLIADATLPTALKTAAGTVNTAIGSMVATKTADQRNSSGISIYLPTGPDDEYLGTYAATAKAFCDATGWNTFAKWFAGPAGTLPRSAAAATRSAGATTREFQARQTAIDWAAYAALRGESGDESSPSPRSRIRVAAAAPVARS